MSLDLFNQPKPINHIPHSEKKVVRSKDNTNWFADYKHRRDKVISEMFYNGGPIPGNKDEDK